MSGRIKVGRCAVFVSNELTTKPYEELLIWTPYGVVLHVRDKRNRKGTKIKGVSMYESLISDKVHPRKVLNRMFKIPTIKYIGRI